MLIPHLRQRRIGAGIHVRILHGESPNRTLSKPPVIARPIYIFPGTESARSL